MRLLGAALCVESFHAMWHVVLADAPRHCPGQLLLASSTLLLCLVNVSFGICLLSSKALNVIWCPASVTPEEGVLGNLNIYQSELPDSHKPQTTGKPSQHGMHHGV
jgi:hypothetical protein